MKRLLFSISFLFLMLISTTSESYAESYTMPYLEFRGVVKIDTNGKRIENNTYFVVCDATDKNKYITILYVFSNTGTSALISRQVCGALLYVEGSASSMSFVMATDAEVTTLYQIYAPIVQR